METLKCVLYVAVKKFTNRLVASMKIFLFIFNLK